MRRPKQPRNIIIPHVFVPPNRPKDVDNDAAAPRMTERRILNLVVDGDEFLEHIAFTLGNHDTLLRILWTACACWMAYILGVFKYTARFASLFFDSFWHIARIIVQYFRLDLEFLFFALGASLGGSLIVRLLILRPLRVRVYGAYFVSTIVGVVCALVHEAILANVSLLAEAVWHCLYGVVVVVRRLWEIIPASLEDWAVLSAVVLWMLREPERRQDAIIRAWQVVLDSHNKPGGGGRSSALELLNNSQGRRRHPYVWLKYAREDLSRIDLACDGPIGAMLDCIDLSGAMLDQAELANASLFKAKLRRARLVRAKCSGADLWYADLKEAVLAGADLGLAVLCGADLRRAILVKASLQGADLRGAKLWRADLRGADLRMAKLGGARFKNAVCNSSTIGGEIPPTQFPVGFDIESHGLIVDNSIPAWWGNNPRD